MKLPHYVIVVLGCAVAALGFLAKDPAYASWAGPVLAVLSAIMGYLGLSTGKAFGGGSGPTGAAVILLTMCVAGGNAACGPQGQAIVPAASCVASVIADALAGLTIAQILAKEQGACVSDAEQILMILLGSNRADVAGSPAFAEARARRQAGQ